MRIRGTCELGSSAWLRLGCTAGLLMGVAGSALAQDMPPAPGDRLGEAVAFGDFNGDKRIDVAVAAPKAKVSGLILIRVPPFAPDLAADGPLDGPKQAGKVLIFMATAEGFTASRPLDQGLIAVNQDGDEFGRALVAADFNGDGIDDLAVGSPGEPLGGALASGAVFLYRGSQSGLVPVRAISQETGELDTSVAADRFGAVLTAGDYSGDGIADLAVAAPGKGRGAGAVFVFRGLAAAMDAQSELLTGMQRIDQSLDQIADVEPDDRFGTAMVTFDLNGDDRDDLVVGSPGEGLASEPRNSGAIFTFRSMGTRLVAGESLDQESGDTGSFMNAAGDTFGSSLAAGDFDGDKRMDLAVGAPTSTGRDVGTGTGTEVGSVFIFRGSTTGLRVDRAFKGNAADNARYGTALSAGDYNGDGRADLVVGAPGRTGGRGAIGTVFLLISTATDILQARASIPDTRDMTRGELGAAVASADLDRDGMVDLAVGVPGAATSGVDAGRLLLLTGNASPGLGDARDLVSLRSAPPPN